MHHPFDSLTSRRVPAARRMLVLLGCFGLSLGLAGCFNAEAEPGNEAAAVAEALTRSVSFVGGSLEDGPLPGADDESVSLVPLESSVLLTPGEANLMSLMPDNPDQVDDPVDAVLIQFGVANKHIEVTVNGNLAGSEGDSTVSLGFDVADDVCNTLCNKRFSVPVKQQLKLRSGKKGRAVSRTVDLECSSRGSAKYCSDARPNVVGTGGDLEKRVLDNLESCDLIAVGGRLSVNRLPCLWECLADLDCVSLRSGLCGGATDITSSCAASCTDEALAQFDCDDGSSVSALFECDGEEDCADGSDESACDSFTCDGLSFPDYYKCDLSQDCSDGSDEVGCAELSCSGDTEPAPTAGASGGEAGSFGGAAGASMTAGTGGFSDPADGADAGPRAGAGTGGIGGVGGSGDADAGVVVPPGEYGAPCADDVDCGAAAPHCEPMPSGTVCSINCSIQCPPLPGSGFVPSCIAGICTGG